MKNQKIHMKQAINIYEGLPFNGRGNRKVCLRVLLFFIFHFSFFISSCMQEDLSDCYDETTLTLQFELLNENLENILQTHINEVDVVLFNGDTLYYRQVKVPTAAPGGVLEVTLPVEAGDYFVVAWGNLAEESLSGSTPTNGHFSGYTYSHNLQATWGERLYYAPSKTSRSVEFEPYHVEARTGEDTRRVLSFMPATHTILIYVKGFEGETAPEAFLTDVPGGYDLHLNPLWEQTATYSRITVTDETEETSMLMASFHIPHFDNENTIVAGIRSEANNLYDMVRLEEYMADHEITVSDGQACEIPILFEYYEGVLVGVSLPDWNSTGTGGGFK